MEDTPFQKPLSESDRLAQAERLANDVLLHERRTSAEQHWWSARVPLMLRCEELHELEPHERAHVVKQAEAQAHEQHALTYLCAVLGLTIGGALLLLATGGPHFDWTLAAYIVAVALPSIGYAKLVVKPRVRQAAREFSQTRPRTF
jgi:hypothetical protein